MCSTVAEGAEDYGLSPIVPGRCLAAMGIVHQAAAAADVLPAAIEMAQALAAKAGPTMQAIKTRMYAEHIRLPNNSSGTSAPA